MDGLEAPADAPAGADLSRTPSACGSRSQRGREVSAEAAIAELAGEPFWKMSGGGNDFVVFDNRRDVFPKGRPEVVAALCARGLGVGADAVLLLEPPETGEADFRMTYYNADGSEAPMCGNGALCIARFAREIGLAKNGAVDFETGSGLYRAELSDERPSRVRLLMRDPKDVRTSLPEIEARGYAHAGLANTGTPHLIVLVPDLARVDVAKEGEALRWHPLFQPHGLNVNFVVVLGRRELATRTYERGVEDETLSCGTGAAAAATLTHLWGLTEPPVVVHPPGGFDLTVHFQRVSDAAVGHVMLEGDARMVFKGQLAGA
jgi:diaminopimelate epimerase